MANPAPVAVEVNRGSGPDRAPSREAFAYAWLAGALTLWAAMVFFSSLRFQLFLSTSTGAPFLGPDDWSAPLDDVFIHFDFARSVAMGHPFEWSPGNGYSSGGTSLLYPFVLAIGYAAGFHGTSLMLYAGVVGATSVFGVLLGARRLFRELPWWTKYAAPFSLLSMGALDWTLFSGMEVAFFLAVWTVAFVAWDDLLYGLPGETPAEPSVGRAGWLGLTSAVVVATRPEAAVCVAVFGLAAAWHFRSHGAARAFGIAVLTGAPGALVLVAQAIANKVLTGDYSAAGALVKLEMHHPLLTADEVFDAWLFHLRYQILRVTGYHAASNVYWGLLLWIPCAAPLFFRATRRYALLLWATAIVWILVVSLNGQVRWQNERYTMPAVAWLLLSGGLGIGALLSWAWARDHQRAPQRWGVLVGVCALVSVIVWQQFPRFRDQVWFFGRASRNIRDQHMVAARRLKHLSPAPHRVLVGDAGAIPYVSGIPALDIIGLGGYSDLPFARASRWGVGAAVELVERMPVLDRPDVLAIYPTWWGDLPVWFGRPFDRVPVRGNVICGGHTKVLYRADWRALHHSAVPGALGPRTGTVAAVDFADIVSEKERAYSIDGAVGFVTMKLLPDPEHPKSVLWDAGRVVPPGATVHFTMTGFSPRRPARLRLRTAPAQDARLAVLAGPGAPIDVVLSAHDGWSHVDVDVPADRVARTIEFSITAHEHEVVLYHAWGLQSR